LVNLHNGKQLGDQEPGVELHTFSRCAPQGLNILSTSLPVK